MQAARLHATPKPVEPLLRAFFTPKNIFFHIWSIICNIFFIFTD